ncbi:MAG: class I SAM-dependent methyltransferase [Cytophagaceae bacterium]|nr:class I SAM-dependent methyltransferase [Gemmatimonadaceae bacterium]
MKAGARKSRASRPSRTARDSRDSRSSSAEWWSSYFTDDYLLEFEPIFDATEDRRQVSRLIELLGLPSGARILDVPCGQGRHAHLLAEAGFSVNGLDYSPALLARAKARGTDPDRLRYTRGDMRSLPAKWTGRFDAVVNLFTSFGFFMEPADDARVIAEFARALKPGGMLVWHGGSRDGVMARFLAKDWWTTSDGTLVGQERSFDPLSGILTIHSTFSGGPREMPAREHRIRLYTATRLSELMRDSGLVVEGAYDAWEDRALRRTSSEMLLVARKA